MQEELRFEDMMQVNGAPYWWASDLRIMLGVSEQKEFNAALEKAIRTAMATGTNWMQDFRGAERGQPPAQDYKLTRFACLLVTLNCNPDKYPQVQQAQVYLVNMTEHLNELMAADHAVRIRTRDELKEGNKSLSATASSVGVEDFARFNNAGYKGMYNMLNVELARKRGVDKEELIEYMGRAELAANLFRVSMTEAAIKNENAQGQSAAEGIHRRVGQDVRAAVKKNTGLYPEELPQSQIKLPEAKKQLKSARKDYDKHDKKATTNKHKDAKDSPEQP